MKRRKPLRKGQPLRRISLHRKSELAQYYVVRSAWLRDNPHCEICGAPAQEVHHRKYRHGKLLCDTKWFMSVCAKCHRDKIHLNLKEARKQGWILSR